MEEVDLDALISDVAGTLVDATPLEVEKAKVKALHRQLLRALQQKSDLERLLEHSHVDLERKIQATEKSLAKKFKIRAAIDQNAVETATPNDDAIRELKAELVSTQKSLAEEIQSKRAERMKTIELQNQCSKYKEELNSLKQGEGGENERRVLIQNLLKQRSELIVLIKKQIKLIDILKQQRVHVEAAALLNISESDFLKEVNIGKTIK